MNEREMADIRKIAREAVEDVDSDLKAFGGNALDRFHDLVTPDFVVRLVDEIDHLQKRVKKAEGGLVATLELPVRSLPIKEGGAERFVELPDLLQLVRSILIPTRTPAPVVATAA